jgi:hypothetical protein
MIASLLLAVPAEAHEVAPLPADNLIGNPWISAIVNGQLVVDTTGWVFEGNPSWGTGRAKPDCPGPLPYIERPTLRWARNSGANPELHPNVEVRVHTVVAADPSHRTLKFFMHWVMHRMTLQAHVYGGPSASGPWTPLWMPFEHVETVGWNPPATDPRSDAWRHYTELPGKFDDWYAPVPATLSLAQGHPFYKVELRASYPEPDATTTGNVGGKVTGIYFATAATNTPPVDAGTNNPDAAAADAGSGGAPDAGGGRADTGSAPGRDGGSTPEADAGAGPEPDAAVAARDAAPTGSADAGVEPSPSVDAGATGGLDPAPVDPDPPSPDDEAPAAERADPASNAQPAGGCRAAHGRGGPSATIAIWILAAVVYTRRQRGKSSHTASTTSSLSSTNK